MDRNNRLRLQLIHWSHIVGVEAVLISKRQSPQHHDGQGMVDESEMEDSYHLHHRRTSRHRRWHEIQSDEARNSIFLLMNEDGVAPNSKMNILRGKGGDNGSTVGLQHKNETSNDSQEDSETKNYTKGRSVNGSTDKSLIESDSEDIEMDSDLDDDMARDGKKKSPKQDKDHALDKNSYSSGNFTWGKKANSQANDSEDFVFIPGSKGNIIDEVMTTKKRQPKGSKRNRKKATVKGTKREKKTKLGDDDDDDDDGEHGNKSKQYRPMPSQAPSVDTNGPTLSAIPSSPTNNDTIMTPDIPSKEESGMPTTATSTSPLAVYPNTNQPFDSTTPFLTPVIISTPYPSISSGYTPYPMSSQVEPPTQPKTLVPIGRDPNPLSLVPSSREPSLRLVTRNPSDINDVPSESPTTLDSTDTYQPPSLVPSDLEVVAKSSVPSLKSQPLPTFAPNRWKFLSEVPTKIPLLSGEPSIIQDSKKPTLSQFPTEESKDVISESPTEITTTAVTYAPICALERDCGRSERPI